jgi:hypothetical protein
MTVLLQWASVGRLGPGGWRSTPGAIVGSGLPGLIFRERLAQKAEAAGGLSVQRRLALAQSEWKEGAMVLNFNYEKGAAKAPKSSSLSRTALTGEDRECGIS